MAGTMATDGRRNARTTPNVTALAHHLESLTTTDPDELRREVLAAVGAATASPAPIYCGAATRAGNVVRFTDWLHPPSPAAIAFAAAMKRSPELFQDHLDVACPRPIERQTFVESRALRPHQDLEATQLYRELFEPHGITDEARLLVYHGRQFVGAVSALRIDGQPRFGLADRRRLAPLAKVASKLLVTADVLEREALPDGPAYLWTTPRGAIEYASAGGHAWLARSSFADALAQAVREVDRSEDAVASALLARADAHIVRLDGDGAIRYLVSLRPVEPVSISALAQLSPAQRAIARHAASGASIPEIARALDRSANTVHSQLRQIYRRLDVSSRVELARVLGREPAAPPTRRR
ncbi:LuxR C-terminal-related transcriptional regulator [Myxococcota bacterium]|nr:LuxR C-terminal-related transcriptional regulator [Myxococcota bacterium]